MKPRPEKQLEAVQIEAGGGMEAKGEGKDLRLTDRDRQLMGMLATVRYLLAAQLARLLYAERSSINLTKRLLALGGEGKHGLERPYLKRLSYRGRDGTQCHAWTLTKLGYALAESVLPWPVAPPAVEPGVDFIEHGLMLNELYVQLLAAPLLTMLAAARQRAAGAERPSKAFLRLKANLHAKAFHPGFRWLSHELVRLPWREYELKGGKARDRLIVPDATLELPGELTRAGGAATYEDGVMKPAKPRRFAGRRLFLECETGVTVRPRASGLR